VRKLVLALMIAFAALAVVPGCDSKTDEGGGRSGFWTSRRPANGGPYRWRLLGIGAGLALLSGAGMLALVRRANAQRAARDQQNQQ
jgi:hypothetical protein